MRSIRRHFGFYLAAPCLAGALFLFFLAKLSLPSLPDPLWIGLGGGVLALVYLVSLSVWVLHQCLLNQYSLWLAPLSGGLAGIVLGVALEFLFLQGSVREGVAVNSCLAAGALIPLVLFSKRLFQEQMTERGRSGRLRKWA